ncbi:cupin domain-containing protein [Methylobacterium sp. A49B]|uniref:Cupin domain-containing protein n=1 Tax=Methylobacterium mesophilicum SR1.6/6 TaxID=908290 RepID=A0A6B9FES9_9HYPH|nr:cupin domain-containing protein [Methylobacterium mesophilicum]QGY00706.1 cupin domain-containing protein [Methylobacterium mesophilicum SR1.6/6]
MLTRRGFVDCALCAVLTGFTATAVEAQPQPSAQTSGVTRTILSTEELPGGQYVVVQVAAEIAPGATVARHTHPGIESSVILAGEAELFVDGQPNRTLRAGDSFQVPAVTPHSLRNGSGATRVAGTYTVEKGKPLASPA